VKRWTGDVLGPFLARTIDDMNDGLDSGMAVLLDHPLIVWLVLLIVVAVAQ
jgi:hypothetical protein